MGQVNILAMFSIKIMEKLLFVQDFTMRSCFIKSKNSLQGLYFFPGEERTPEERSATRWALMTTSLIWIVFTASSQCFHQTLFDFQLNPQILSNLWLRKLRLRELRPLKEDHPVRNQHRQNFFFSVELIYNVELVSCAQHTDSVIHIHIHSFPL